MLGLPYCRLPESELQDLNRRFIHGVHLDVNLLPLVRDGSVRKLDACAARWYETKEAVLGGTMQ